MSQSDYDRIRYSRKKVEVVFAPARRVDVVEQTNVCPKCGERGSGPYLRRVGNGDHHGFYYKHSVNGRDVWHYVPKGNASRERREKLVRLLHEQGFRGLRHFAHILNVSARTIRRDLYALQAEGRVIHKSYGTYIADPSGRLLKEKPWLAWIE
jgi:DeoR-like helix-turn-helix domain